MVTWSIPARNDLKQIYDYIAKDSKYYATNVAQNIVSKADNLSEAPRPKGRGFPVRISSNFI